MIILLTFYIHLLKSIYIIVFDIVQHDNREEQSEFTTDRLTTQGGESAEIYT